MRIWRVSAMPRGKWECSGILHEWHWVSPLVCTDLCHTASQPCVVLFPMRLAQWEEVDLHRGPLLASPSDKYASGWKTLKYSSHVSGHRFGRPLGSDRDTTQPPHSDVLRLTFTKPFLSKMMKIFLRVQLPSLAPFLASLRFLWRARHAHSINFGRTKGSHPPLALSEGCVYTPVHHIQSSEVPQQQRGAYLFLSGYRAERNTQLGSKTVANVLLTKRFSSPLIFCYHKKMIGFNSSVFSAVKWGSLTLPRALPNFLFLKLVLRTCGLSYCFSILGTLLWCWDKAPRWFLSLCGLFVLTCPQPL